MKFRELAREVAGFFIFAGFFAVLFALIKLAVPVENREPLLILLGVLAGSFKDVVSFLWGGSMGSERKTEMLKRDENAQP